MIRSLSRTMGACLVAAALLVFAIGAATAPIEDGDGWWTAAAGRAGTPPRINAWAITDASHPWIMHEWLLAPPYAAGASLLGPSFFALAALVFLTATIALVFAEISRATERPQTAALLALAAILCFSKRLVTARPTAVSLFLALAMLAVASRARFGPKHAAAAVGLALVWANAHGSFPLGVALLAASATWSAADRRARVATAVVAALATTVNPYGVRLHALVAAYVLGDPRTTFGSVHAHVAEFAPLWRAPHGTLGPPEWIGLGVAAALSLTATLSRGQRARGVFCLAVGALAAMHVRHVETFGLLALVLLAPTADALVARVVARPSEEPRRAAHVALAVAPALAVGLVALALAQRERTPEAWIADGAGGPSFVRLAARVPDGAHAFVPFGSSGLFLWLTAPRGVRVLYDARNDCYARATAERAFALEDGRSADLDAVDTVLARRDAAVVRVLGEAWDDSARDGAWILFRRRR